MINITEINNKYSFWYRISKEEENIQRLKVKEYESQINKIADFDNVFYILYYRSMIFGVFINI
jgi:hypothetical protein